MCMWAQPSPPIVGEGAGVGSVLFHLCIVITSPRLTPPPSPPLIGAGSACVVQPIRLLKGSAYVATYQAFIPTPNIQMSVHVSPSKRGVYMWAQQLPAPKLPSPFGEGLGVRLGGVGVGSNGRS